MEYEHTFKAPQSCSIVILHKSSELVAGPPAVVRRYPGRSISYFHKNQCSQILLERENSF